VSLPTSTPARKAPEASKPRLSDLFRAWRAQPPRRCPPTLYWTLFILAAALNGAAVGLGVYLLGFAGPPSAPPREGPITIPHVAEAEAWRALARWPVQQDGRVKPFATFCRETVRTVTGSEDFEGHDPVAVVASWLLLAHPDREKERARAEKAGCDWEHHPFILCRDRAMREALYREYRGEGEELSEQDRHGKYIEPAVLRHSRQVKELLESALSRTMRDAKARPLPLEEKAREVNNRLALYDRIRLGGPGPIVEVAAPGDFGLVALDDRGGAWFSLLALRQLADDPSLWEDTLDHRRLRDPGRYPPSEAQPFPKERVGKVVKAWNALGKTYRSGEGVAFGNALSGFLSNVGEASEPGPGEVDDVLLGRELWFHRFAPFRKAWMAGLAAAAFLLTAVFVGARWRKPGRVFYALGLVGLVGCLVTSAVGFWCRVTLSGRPPVSNMYESVVWVAFMTAAIGLALEVVYRRRVIALVASLVATLGFVLADQLPLTFSPAIQPLQAVLRSNYWLVIHVLTIVSSYAAFALAWGLGNVNLVLIVWAPHRYDLMRTLSQFCYRAIQIGVVLLAAGTLLGGFWAAESWGRFWGWDPKEVWALVALLCYLIPLHARYVGWVKDFGLSLCAVVCFSSVVMAWYGVNFVLGAGLHSYGFGGGNDLWVYWGGLLNLGLAATASLRFVARRPALA
jgi:ABC-type transport system involved in cytochrome c biogenesis permease subunit